MTGYPIHQIDLAQNLLLMAGSIGPFANSSAVPIFCGTLPNALSDSVDYATSFTFNPRFGSSMEAGSALSTAGADFSINQSATGFNVDANGRWILLEDSLNRGAVYIGNGGLNQVSANGNAYESVRYFVKLESSTFSCLKNGTTTSITFSEVTGTTFSNDGSDLAYCQQGYWIFYCSDVVMDLVYNADIGKSNDADYNTCVSVLKAAGVYPNDASC